MTTIPITPAVGENFPMNFSFNVVEDPMDSLNGMLSLSAMGSFREARLVYKDSLERYSGAFPIYAEYVRLLYDQGDFSALKDARLHISSGHGSSEWDQRERDVIKMFCVHGWVQYHQNSEEIHRAVYLDTKLIAKHVKRIKLEDQTEEEV